ncbi:MAG: hypothetical protein ACI31M_00380 [Bacilli bacterium]
MKKDKYRNRKYIFQIMDNRSFIWQDIFAAVDEEDMLEQLKMVYEYSEDNDQYRLLKNNNGYESVLTFLHGKEEIEFFLGRMLKILSSKNKKDKSFQEDFIMNICYLYSENDADSKIDPHNKKKCQKRKIDSIDCEMFKLINEETQNEEDKIVETVKKLTLGRYVV